MGCDIHPHVEVKIAGKWEHYSAPDFARNYTLFAKMANVRNGDGVSPVAPRRGVPDDISVVTQSALDDDNGDAHSASWLTPAELREVKEWFENLHKSKHRGTEDRLHPGWFDDKLGWLFGNSVYDFDESRDDYPAGIEDVRLVFWFDN